jgi:hypothetical protein
MDAKVKAGGFVARRVVALRVSNAHECQRIAVPRDAWASLAARRWHG